MRNVNKAGARLNWIVRWLPAHLNHSYLKFLISSFALEAREGSTDHENPSFYSRGEIKVKELLDFRPVCTLRLAFSLFWTSVIGIYRFWMKSIALSPKHAALRISSKMHLPCFCNDFTSGSKTLLVFRWRHRPSRPILRYCSVMAGERVHFMDSKIHPN